MSSTVQGWWRILMGQVKSRFEFLIFTWPRVRIREDFYIWMSKLISQWLNKNCGTSCTWSYEFKSRAFYSSFTIIYGIRKLQHKFKLMDPPSHRNEKLSFLSVSPWKNISSLTIMYRDTIITVWRKLWRHQRKVSEGRTLKVQQWRSWFFKSFT